jgi:hypothetical protein
MKSNDRFLKAAAVAVVSLVVCVWIPGCVDNGTGDETGDGTAGGGNYGEGLAGEWMVYSAIYPPYGEIHYASEEPDKKAFLVFKPTGEFAEVIFNKKGNVWIESGYTTRWRSDGTAIFILDGNWEESEYRIDGNKLIVGSCRYSNYDEREYCYEITATRSNIADVRRSLGAVYTTDPNLYGTWELQGGDYGYLSFGSERFYSNLYANDGYWYTNGNKLYLIGEQCDWDENTHEERCETTGNNVTLTYSVSGSGDNRTLRINNSNTWRIRVYDDDYHSSTAKSRPDKKILERGTGSDFFSALRREQSTQQERERVTAH